MGQFYVRYLIPWLKSIILFLINTGVFHSIKNYLHFYRPRSKIQNIILCTIMRMLWHMAFGNVWLVIQNSIWQTVLMCCWSVFCNMQHRNDAGGILTHYGRMTHICLSKLAIIGSHNGLSPIWRQAFIWTNNVILLNGPLGTNFSEILIEIHIFSFKKMLLKMSSEKRRPFCFCLNVLT